MLFYLRRLIASNEMNRRPWPVNKVAWTTPKYYPDIYLGILIEPRATPVRMACNHAEVRTKYIPSMGLQC